MESYFACRVCLVTGIQFESLDDDPVLGEAYLNIVGEVVYNPLRSVCYECSTLLQKCSELKQKCMRTNTILMNILKEHHMVTYSSIKEVDRKKYQLESNLSMFFAPGIHIPSEVINKNDSTTVNIAIKQEFPAEPSFAFLYPNEKLNSPPVVQHKDVELIKMEALEDMDEFQDETECSDKSVSSLEDTSDDTSDEEKSTRKYKWKKKKRDNDENEKSKEVNERSNDEINNEGNGEEINNEGNGEEINNDETESNVEIENDCSKNNSQKFKFDSEYFREYADVTELTPEMAKQEVLSRKESRNYLNSNFKCDLCFRGFEMKNPYNNHMKKHSSEFGEIECKFCHFRFMRKRSLWQHMYSCHKRKFSCKLCPYECTSSYQARLHVKLHKGKKYICSCGETFGMPNSLAMHKRIKHGAECVCDLCGCTFASSRGLRGHILYIHRQEQNEKRGPFCSECNIHFANDTAWKRHLVLSSKHTVSNGCEHCGETFGDEHELKKHSSMHSRKYNRNNKQTPNKLPSGCVMCNHWLTTRTEYKEHMLSAHPDSKSAKKFQNGEPALCVCEYCGKSFKQKCLLVYHLNEHSGARPYKCSVCGKPFGHPGAVAVHKMTHRSSSPKSMHKCHLCPKRYKHKGGLNKHLKAHMGIRPHKCKICDKSFLNLCEVRVHIQYVHDKVPWPKRDRSKRKRKINQVDKQVLPPDVKNDSN